LPDNLGGRIELGKVEAISTGGEAEDEECNKEADHDHSSY